MKTSLKDKTSNRQASSGWMKTLLIPIATIILIIGNIFVQYFLGNSMLYLFDISREGLGIVFFKIFVIGGVYFLTTAIFFLKYIIKIDKKDFHIDKLYIISILKFIAINIISWLLIGAILDYTRYFQ